MLLFALGCAKPAASPAEALDSAAERDPAVAAEAPIPVLLAALGADDGEVQALAVEALLVRPLPCGAEATLCGLAPALAMAPRDDDRVRLAVARGLAAHPAEIGRAHV